MRPDEKKLVLQSARLTEAGRVLLDQYRAALDECRPLLSDETLSIAESELAAIRKGFERLEQASVAFENAATQKRLAKERAAADTATMSEPELTPETMTQLVSRYAERHSVTTTAAVEALADKSGAGVRTFFRYVAEGVPGRTNKALRAAIIALAREYVK